MGTRTLHDSDAGTHYADKGHVETYMTGMTGGEAPSWPRVQVAVVGSIDREETGDEPWSVPSGVGAATATGRD